jgi:predicted dehydrogenase
MLDMGPYYVTALVALLGPVRSVCASTASAHPVRTISSEPFKGRQIKVEVPTHVAGVLNFAGGAVATLVTSFDVWHHRMPWIEIYGTEGSLSVPDPNTFGGPVQVRRSGDAAWSDVTLTHGYSENSRGVGVADLACAVITDRPHRASGDLAFHALDIMQALHEASDQGRTLTLESSCDRPAPLPQGLPDGRIDL